MLIISMLGINIVIHYYPNTDTKHGDINETVYNEQYWTSNIIVIYTGSLIWY